MSSHLLQEDEEELARLKHEASIPFYAERRQTGFDGLQRFRFFKDADDRDIAVEIAFYQKRGWVVKEQGYRTWQNQTSYAVEFTPTIKHAMGMKWKQLKWNLFGEVKIIFWALAAMLTLAAAAFVGFIWVVVKLAQHFS